jgi:AraC-like DNA-binding protein
LQTLTDFAILGNNMASRKSAENAHFGKLLVHSGKKFDPPRPDAWAWRVFRSRYPRPFGWLAAGGYVLNNWGIPREKPWRIGRFSLVYLLEGEGFFVNAAGVDRSLRAGDLLLLFPDVAHAYGPRPGQLWHDAYLLFDGPVFRLWRSERLIDPARPVYHLEPIENWARRFDAIMEPLATPGYQQTIRDVCRLQEVLADVLVQRQSQRVSNEDQEWLQRARQLLVTMPVDDDDKDEDVAATSKETWDRISQTLGTSYESFRKRFTRLEGIPPARYRMNRLIDRACELIFRTDMTIKQVAFQLGFANAFYFSRRFKQVTGVSPRAYRHRFDHGGE